MKRMMMIPLIAALSVMETAAEGQQEQISPGPAAGTITLYTSVERPAADKIQSEFQRKFPAVTLVVFRSESIAVVAKIEAEKQAGGIAADVLWIDEPSEYENLKNQDLLLQFFPEDAVNLPEEMRDPEEYYYAAGLTNMIIGYHTGLKNPPRNWKDLLSPAYRGNLVFPSPNGFGAAEALVQTLADYYGWEFFTGFAANGGVQAQDFSTVLERLSSGETQVGVLPDYLVRTAKEKGSPVDYVWPRDGAVCIPSPVAIVKSTENPEAAKAFVDFLLSRDGQAVLVESGGYVPVRVDASPPKDSPPVDYIKKLPTNWIRVWRQRQHAKIRWQSVFSEASDSR